MLDIPASHRSLALAALFSLFAIPALAGDIKGAVPLATEASACDAATEGAILYNTTDNVMEFCNGTTWTQFVQQQTAPGITAPAGSGYFVLTSGTYNGNRGNLAGADATCLTDLTTNTGWLGYADANSNGQLVSGKVKSFMCNTGVCNNLMPLTTYYFANAGNGSAGGASFTTDGSGYGPGDSSPWSAANYFSGSYEYMTGRATGTATLWGGTAGGGFWTNCEDWNSSSSSRSSARGASTETTAARWNNSASGSCDVLRHLICFVNP